MLKFCCGCLSRSASCPGFSKGLAFWCRALQRTGEASTCSCGGHRVSGKQIQSLWVLQTEKWGTGWPACLVWWPPESHRGCVAKVPVSLCHLSAFLSYWLGYCHLQCYFTLGKKTGMEAMDLFLRVCWRSQAEHEGSGVSWCHWRGQVQRPCSHHVTTSLSSCPWLLHLS